MVTAFAKTQRITADARLYCGHVLTFKAIYLPAVQADVWCYRCENYSRVHDHPLPACASSR